MSTPTTVHPSGPRAARGTSTTLWDGRVWPCAGRYAGAPVFRYGWAPSGLVTFRQLAALGLRPAGQDVAGWLVWGTRPGRRGWARLFRVDVAAPKRVPSAAQRAAIDRCNAVQRWCRSCRRDVGYRVPRSLGECVDCAATAAVRDRARHELADQAARYELADQAASGSSEMNDMSFRVGHSVGVVMGHVELRESA